MLFKLIAFGVWTLLSVVAGYYIGKKNAVKLAAAEAKAKAFLDAAKADVAEVENIIKKS
jgi:ABC-type thiamin/hydroxymethylpyrimidine transport system permease subunit